MVGRESKAALFINGASLDYAVKALGFAENVDTAAKSGRSRT
jgi:hypothetical protein